MSDAKTLILATTLSFHKPFKASHVFQLTELSRELVRYHLTKFTEQGFLEKNGLYYSIQNKDGLLNLLHSEPERASINRLRNTGFIQNAEKWNEWADMAAAARKLHLPYASEMADGIVDEIEKTIASLKDLRKYVRSKEMVAYKAAEILHEVSDVYEIFSRELSPHISKTEFVEKATERVMTNA